ncbi:MAG: 30S ribosome-binding factor RbfA [Candidatus Hydrothermia bacterium]
MKPYKRSERVAHEVFRILSEALLFEVKDPRVQGITIIRVDLTDDLKFAKVYYETAKEESVKGLESAKGFLRSVIARELRIKFVPEIEFVRVDNGWISQYL